MTEYRSLTARLDAQLLPPHPHIQMVCFLFPFVVVPTVLSLIWLFCGYEKMAELVSLAAFAFVAAGKFITFAPVMSKMVGFERVTYSIWEMALMIAAMDTITAIFLTYNLHYLLKLPKIGLKLKDIRKDCYYLLQANPWMRRLAFTVVIMFVAFPVSGTGAIAGAFLALFLGISRISTVITITFGGFAGSFGMATGAYFVGKNAESFFRNPIVSISLAVILFGSIFWAGYKMKKMIHEQKRRENPIL